MGWTETPGRIYQLHDGSVSASLFTLTHQRRHAKIVRRRLRDDPGIPKWAKRLISLIWVGQHAALGAHAIVSLLRRFRGRSGRASA